MRFAYSAHAASAQPGSLALTATTCRRGTRLSFFGRFHRDRLAALHFLQVVALAHRGVHPVHHHVAEVDQHPFAALLAFDAVHAAALLADALLHALGERLDLAVRLAARDHHALEHRRQARGVEHLDVAPLHVLERLDHHALLDADVHQRPASA